MTEKHTLNASLEPLSFGIIMHIPQTLLHEIQAFHEFGGKLKRTDLPETIVRPGILTFINELDCLLNKTEELESVRVFLNE